MNSIAGYDDWKLRGPDDDRADIGTEEGQTCNRAAEPDEDAPRGHRAKPCSGVMHYAEVEGCTCHVSPPCWRCEGNPLVCDTCGEEA